MMTDVIYAIRLERMTYGRLQILRIKIGRTNDIDRTIRQYRRTHSDPEILHTWIPNSALEVSTVERGIHDIAELLAYERNREIFTFLQDKYDDFASTVSNLLLERDGIEDITEEPDEFAVVSNGKFTIEFIDEETLLSVVHGTNQTEVMINGVNYLINEQQLLDNIDIPWIPGRKKAIINDTDKWEHSSSHYRKLERGYYLDTKLSSISKQRELDRLAKRCDISVQFKGDW